jgi:hypothetical protein
MKLLDKVKAATGKDADFVDKLYADRAISKRVLDELRDVRRAWMDGEICCGADTVFSTLCGDVVALSKTPLSTFKSWLGRKGINARA